MPASANPRGAENRTRRRSARTPRAGSTPPDPAAADSTPQADAATQPDYRVEALAKGLRVLSVFSEQRPTWRITDIAAEVSLPLPTAYRIVMTLTAEGYLDHLPSGEYRPGVRVLTLGTAALRSLDLAELATPTLQDLANATRETVNLAVLTGDQVLYLVRLRNSDLVTANIRVGSLLPAVHTSIGKLLLAFLGEDELAKSITSGSFDGTTGPNAKRSLDGLRPGLGHAVRGAGLRAALGGGPGARRERRRRGGREPGRAVPRLAGRPDHPRAAADGAGDRFGDLAAAGLCGELTDRWRDCQNFSRRSATKTSSGSMPRSRAGREAAARDPSRWWMRVAH